MARSPQAKKAVKTLSWLLAIIVGLTGILAGGIYLWDKDNASWAPKLALDLEGGTQIILAAITEDGAAPSAEQMQQAVAIIRDRVDASGVSEAEVSTQGSRNIVVAIPGTPDEETMNRIERSAKLDFRAVLTYDVPTATATEEPTDEATEEATDAPEEAEEPAAEPENGSDLAWITPDVQERFDAFTCDSVTASDANAAPADEPLIACDIDGSLKYILGPVEVSGDMISDASAGLTTNSQGATTGTWAVNIVLDGEGTDLFADVSQRLYNLTGAQNQFGIVLDGVVISAPTMNGVISNGKPQITGGFTQESAQSLADQLKFGALPLSFEVQSNENVSATLGASQLQSGIIAGIIGLILVILYSLMQYRTLGLVTVASLVIVGVITYLVIAILSWRQGYRLSLAGVTGLIVAVGITADSFIVYFERVRDELRDGRSLGGAVENGWRRAFRTIAASDAVNFLAAAVLFLLAIGNVRGFAFTLGITTLVDLLVVALFTHPLLTLLSGTRFFSGGHPLSGLNPKALGAVYRGRAQFREPVAASASKRASSSREAARRQTIAERKAAGDAPTTSQRPGKDS